MKKIISILAGFCMAVLMITDAHAQTMVADGITDSVTVGSIMPYAVTRDADIEILVGAGALDSSQFDWTIGGGGLINEAPIPGLGLYSDSITVTWPVAPVATTVSVAENSIRLGAVACADTTPSIINVAVIAVPTIQYSGVDTGACGAADYDVPLSLSGISPWTVTYNIDYTPIGGASSNLETGTQDQITSNALPITSAQLGSGSGTYVVTLTNLDDRISSKALNGGAVNGTINGSTTYTIYVFPQPNTSPIKHIQN